MDDTTDVADRCFHPPHGIAPCRGSWTVTAAQQLEFMDATMQHLEQALASMDVQHKTAIVSTEINEDSYPLNSSVFDAMLLKHGAMCGHPFYPPPSPPLAPLCISVSVSLSLPLCLSVSLPLCLSAYFCLFASLPLHLSASLSLCPRALSLAHSISLVSSKQPRLC